MRVADRTKGHRSIFELEIDPPLSPPLWVAVPQCRVVSLAAVSAILSLAIGAEHTPRSVATSDSRGVSSIAFC